MPGISNGYNRLSRKHTGPWCATAPRSRRSPTILAGTPATVTLFGTVLEHHRAGRDARATADLDIAEDLGARADHARRRRIFG